MEKKWIYAVSYFQGNNNPTSLGFGVTEVTMSAPLTSFEQVQAINRFIATKLDASSDNISPIGFFLLREELGLDKE